MTTEVTNTNGDDEFDKAFAEYTGAPAAADDVNDDDEHDGDDGEDEARNEAEEADRQAATQAEGDPLASLPDEARRLVAEAQARAAAAEHAARSNAGRVSALQRKVDELQKSPRTETTGGADKGTPGDGSDTDDDSFGEEFSEVADFVQRTVEQTVAPIKAKLDEREAEDAALREQAELQQAFTRLAEAHPDFDQIRNDPDYGKWLASQAPGVRNLAASTDPEDAIALCGLYKKEKGIERAPSRADLLAAAEEIPSKGGSRKSGIPDDFDTAFEHFASKKR